MRTPLTLLFTICSLILTAQDYTQYDAVKKDESTKLFFDDFRDNSNNWIYRDNLMGPKYAKYDKFAYVKVINGKLSFNFVPNYIFGSVHTFDKLGLNNEDDFQFEARLRYKKQGGDPHCGGIGLRQRDDSYHYTLLCITGGKWTFFKRSGENNIAEISTWVEGNNILKGGDNVLTLRKVGNTLYFFINGEFLISKPCNHRFNDVTIEARSGIVEVDWIRIDRIGATATIASATDGADNVTITQTREQPSSDVDLKIPSNSFNNENTFALVVGNENYLKEIAVDYAINDAAVFKTYLEQTLGLPSSNIRYLEDASYGSFMKELQWMENIALAFQGDAKLIFYYAGHGVPDEGNQTAYLLPVDGSSSMANVAIPVSTVYESLTKHPTQSATVFLDACFSGGARSGMLASGRGVAIKPKEEPLKNNLVVFSAASGEQTAHPYDDKKHGLFTYFLLKKLQESKGEVTLGELNDYLNKMVSRNSILVNEKVQIPQVNVSPTVREQWENWKLK